VNIDQAMISRIEKGERPVMDYELVAIAKALRIESAQLLSDYT
jgi:transcriptional regulator with XRE-family HTH domain